MMKPHPTPRDYAGPQDYIRACAQWLIEEAYDLDVVVTITQQSYPPLAMRRYHTVAEVREQR